MKREKTSIWHSFKKRKKKGIIISSHIPSDCVCSGPCCIFCVFSTFIQLDPMFEIYEGGQYMKFEDIYEYDVNEIKRKLIAEICVYKQKNRKKVTSCV